MFNSLRSRLTLFFIALSVIPLVIVGLIISQRGYLALEQQALTLQNEVASRVSVEIANFFQQRENELQSLVSVRGLTTLSPDAQRDLFSSLISYQGVYQELALLDDKGQELIRLSRSEAVTPDELANHLQDDVFLYPTTKGSIYYGPVRFDETLLEPLLPIAIPITDLQSGKVDHVLVAQLSFKAIWDLMVDLRLKAGTDVYVVDAQNQVVAYRNPSIVLRGTTFTPPQQAGRTTGLFGNDVILATAAIPLGNQALVVVAEEPFILATDLASQLATIAFVAVAVILVVAVILALVLVRQIVRPVERLSKIARAIQGGDLSQRADVSRRDEIGGLAVAFNSMTEQLRSLISGLEDRVAGRTRDMAITIEVGKLATSIYNQAELLPQLVEFIRARFGLYYTQIYLLDEAKQYAVLRAGTGDIGQQLLARQHRLNVEETSLVARAVQTSQTVLVSDTETSPIHKKNPLLPDTRSELTIPLIVGNEILGVLDMQADKADTFNPDNMGVFEAMASQIAATLRGAQTYEEAQMATRRAEAMNQRLTADTWISYLGQLGEDRYLGYEYDLETPKPLQPSEADGQQPADEHSVVHPILLRGQQIGQIAVREDRPHDWDKDELHLINDVAQRVALALDQFRAFDQIKQAEAEVSKRAAEMETVARVSAITTSILDVDELLQTVVDLTKSSFNLYHAHIYLLDDAGENLALVAGAGEAGRRMKAEGRSIALKRARSLVARAARERQSVIANNVGQEPDFLPNPLLPYTRSEMAIPMLVAGQLIGVLDVQADSANRFTAEDVRVQTTLAEQVSVAVQNARSFQEAQRQAAIIETSRDFIAAADLEGNIVYVNPGGLEMVGATSYEGCRIASYYPEEDYQIIQREALPLVLQEGYWRGQVNFRREDGSIFPVDETIFVVKDKDGKPINLATIVTDITDRKQQEEEIQRNAQLIRTVIDATPDWIFAKDHNFRYVLANQGYANAIGTTTDGIVGKTDLELGFPEELVLGDPDKGIRGFRADDTAVLETGQTIYNPNDPARFADGTIHVFDTQKMPLRNPEGDTFAVLGFARDITERQKQEEAVRQAREEAEVLYRVSTDINEAKNVQDIVDAVARYALPKETFTFSLIAWDTGDIATATVIRILAAWTRDIGTSMEETTLALADFEALIPPDPSQIRVIDDVLKDPNVPEHTREMYRSLGIIGTLSVPLIIGNRNMGAVNIATDTPYHFTERDLRVFNAIGHQVSVILERFNLIEETQKRAAEMETVAKVGAASTTLLNVDDLLQSVADLTKEGFGLYHAHIYLLDEAGENLVLAAGAGAVGHQMKERGHQISIHRQNSLVARAAREREAVVVNDISQAPDHLPNPLLPETQSEMALPMLVRDELIGVLDVQSEETNRFTNTDVQVQTTLADQVAIAVQNARAFQQSQKRADEMAIVARVSEKASGTMDPAVLVTDVAQLIASGFNLYHTHIYLVDKDGQNLIFEAGAGRAECKHVGKGHQVSIDDQHSLVAQAARQRHGVINHDVTTAPDFILDPNLPDKRSHLAIPMLVGDELIGILEAHSDSVGEFTEEDVQIKTILAEQVALAIQNASAFQQQLQTAERLREVDRLKSQFLANMSHELRTPLNSIIGYAEVLMDGIDGDLGEEAMEDVHAIHGGGKHLLSIINDILDLAKIEAGQMYMDRQETDITKVIDEVIRTCQILIKDKGISLEVECPESLPTVYADPVRLRQIVFNLVNNAIKFTEKGSVTLALGLKNDRELIVKVRDSGIGMSEEDLKVIFERFRQVDGSATRRAGGTGLGLNITRHLVHMHEGEISVESTPGVGSAFIFTLPIFAQQKAKP